MVGDRLGEDVRESEAPSDAAPGCAARLAWMFAGNLLLVIFGLTILRLPPWTLTWRDLAFFVVVGSSMLARYVDVSRLGGRTADGAPATMAQLKRYFAGLTALASGGWVTAQSIQV